MSPTSYRSLILLTLLLGIVVSACSLQYVDAHGARHIWGLSHTVVREARGDRSEVVAQQISTIGAAVLLVPEHSGLSFGYTRNFSITISSADEAGEISFPPDNPTAFHFKDLRNIMGGLK